VSPEPEASPPDTARVVVLAAATYLATLFVFLAAQVVQLVNLPFGLIATSLFVFGAAGLACPAAFNLRPLPFAGLGRVPWGLVGLAFLCGLANLGFANAMMGGLRELLPRGWSRMADDVTRLLAGADPTSRVLIAIGAGVAAPIGEELFFRGWLQGLVSRRFSRLASIVVVAVLFSALHMDPVGFLPRVELGILFGLMRAWTGSLYPAMATHAAHNLASTALLYLSDDPVAELDAPFDAPLTLGLGLASLVFTYGALRLTQGVARTHALPESPDAAARPGVAPFRLVTVRALLATAASFALLGGSAGVLYALRDELPGAALSRSLLPPAR
jgi:membrane protease YdiL (CAAX protease family)